MELNSKIFVAGEHGMAGGAIVRKLKELGYTNVLSIGRGDVDFRNQADVDSLFKIYRPEYVFIAAGKVGGIWANTTYRADFIYDNIMIATNIIHAAHKYVVKRLINLGSSCIYPRNSDQPIKEEYLMTADVEPTNAPYAHAKICAIKTCTAYREQHGSDFISLMPTNMYGAGDNFNLQTAHVISALLRKIHEAKVNNDQTVTIWGSGTPKREFLFVDDFAEACIYIMNSDNKAIYDKEFINVGTGSDVTISELATIIKKVVGYEGDFIYDSTKPDGMPRKLLNCDFIHSLGWQHTTTMEDGLKVTYEALKEQLATNTRV